MKKVFLGGTCNNSNWRASIITQLSIDYFDPVVDDWNEAAYQRELKERETCDYCLYLITAKMQGVYSIAEAVDDSNKRPEKTVFCFSEVDGIFDPKLLKSLQAVGKMINNNGAIWCKTEKEVVDFLNS